MKGEKKMKCKICGAELLPMLLPGSFFCPNDCDKKNNNQQNGKVTICAYNYINNKVLSEGEIELLSNEAAKEYTKINLLDSSSKIDDFYKVFTKDLIDEILNRKFTVEDDLFDFIDCNYYGKFNSLSDFAQVYLFEMVGSDFSIIEKTGIRNFIDHNAWIIFQIKSNKFAYIKDKNSSDSHVFRLYDC